MRRRIEQLVVKLFPLPKRPCQSERREIIHLRAWKQKQITFHVEQSGEAKLIEYEQKAKSTGSQRVE